MSLQKFMKQNNMLAPGFQMPDYDEEKEFMEHREASRNPFRDTTDHPDEVASFDIYILNKGN